VNESLSEIRELPELDETKAAPPCAIVIFGAAGDLTRRLVIPALYQLARTGRLSDQFHVIGVDLAQKSTMDWTQDLATMMRELVGQMGAQVQFDEFDRAVWRSLCARMTYVQGDLNDPGLYARLRDHLVQIDRRIGTAGNYLFYLAIADRFFDTAVSRLGAAGLTRESEGSWRRLIIEKPFGHDLNSAQALNARMLTTLRENQIYRIDHFLGKETVQNLMALRFANGLFEPIWNRGHIDHVQITAAETVGVERRGAFYDRTGALRDMVPNHLFQLLAMTAMEPPVSFEAEAVRAKKTEAIQSIRPVSEFEILQNSVRGQYASGEVLGKTVNAYRDAPDVAVD